MADFRFPDFYIVGAAKAGTTSLVDLLHPVNGLFFPLEKEPHHFFVRDDPREWTIRDGRRVRPLVETLPFAGEAAYLRLYEDAPAGAVRGDASTQYLVNETVPSAIFKAREDARIIVVLRDPVERAYSAWLHAAARGEDEAGFEEALDECQAGERRTSFAINYIDEGRYDLHLACYHAVFGEQVKVILFDDLVRDPLGIRTELCDYLRVAAPVGQDATMAHRNQSVELRNPVARQFRLAAKRLRRMAPGVLERPLVRKPYEYLLSRIGSAPKAMNDSQRRRLAAIYAPHTEALERMLGRDLSHWGRGAPGG